VETRDVVLVTGPWLAGTTSVIAALRERVPHITFVETGELSVVEAPAAVVFVASAVARLTESDCALLDLAAANTDLVIGVVSKIDVHRSWRDTLAADRQALIAHDARFRDVSWVGVAASPDLGDPMIDELTERLGHLGDARLARRNRLRAWETRLTGAVRRAEEEADAADSRLVELREQRSTAVRERRLAKSDRTIALRSQIQQARAQLSYFARNRCASVRTELSEDAAAMTRRKLRGFEGYVSKRVDDVVAEVNNGVADHLRDMAAELHLKAPREEPPPASPPIPPTQLKSRKLETRLMMLLGAGFGLGLALTLSRLFTNLAPGYSIAGLVAGGVIGLVVTVCVVGMRGLLHDRAVLDRWVADVVGELRAAADALVAARVLAAETALATQLASLDVTESADLAEDLAAIDGEMRHRGLAAARAAAVRNRQLPEYRNALERVREELDGG
jgi:hypothetical protein